jgi:hypothetical protein
MSICIASFRLFLTKSSRLGVVENVRVQLRSRRWAQGALLWGRLQPEERSSTSTLRQKTVAKVVPCSRLAVHQPRPSTQLVALDHLWSLTLAPLTHFFATRDGSRNFSSPPPFSLLISVSISETIFQISEFLIHKAFNYCHGWSLTLRGPFHQACRSCSHTRFAQPPYFSLL